MCGRCEPLGFNSRGRRFTSSLHPSGRLISYSTKRPQNKMQTTHRGYSHQFSVYEFIAEHSPHLSLGPGIPEPAAVFLQWEGHDRHSFAQDGKVADRVVFG